MSSTTDTEKSERVRTHCWLLPVFPSLNQRRILDLSPSVTGRAAAPIDKKWGPFVPVLPHWNKHQALGDLGRSSLKTARDSGLVNHRPIVGQGEPF